MIWKIRVILHFIDIFYFFGWFSILKKSTLCRTILVIETKEFEIYENKAYREEQQLIRRKYIYILGVNLMFHYY